MDVREDAEDHHRDDQEDPFGLHNFSRFLLLFLGFGFTREARESRTGAGRQVGASRGPRWNIRRRRPGFRGRA